MAKEINTRDLEVGVDLVFEAVKLKGTNRSHYANHELMDYIVGLGLDEIFNRECWHYLWGRIVMN